jgi:hypothetical protein
VRIVWLYSVIKVLINSRDRVLFLNEPGLVLYVFIDLYKVIVLYYSNCNGFIAD